MSEEFNAADFISTVNSDTVETKFTPVPEGDYPASVVPGSIKFRKAQFKDNRIGCEFAIQWKLDDEVAGMKQPTVRQKFLLDIDGFRDNGQPILKTGANQNIRLGRLIELSGQNPKSGWSYSGLEAVRGKVRVEHRPDKNDAEIVYADVVAVAAL